jgi:hypothetical protein
VRRVFLANRAIRLQALALVTLVAAVRSGTPLWVCGGVAFVVGLGEPQVGGSLRALWPTLVAQEYRRFAAVGAAVERRRLRAPSRATTVGPMVVEQCLCQA